MISVSIVGSESATSSLVIAGVPMSETENKRSQLSPTLTSTVGSMPSRSIVCFELSPPTLMLEGSLVADGALDEDVVEVCKVERCGVEAVIADSRSADAHDIDAGSRQLDLRVAADRKLWVDAFL
jgi:hypothetical protein